MESHAGPAYRMVTRFAADGTPESFIDFPRGNSGDPSSPHWSDAQSDWEEGVYHPLAYAPADIEAAAAERVTLE